MTSRERIIQSFRHKEPDRIPFDLGGTESSGITGIAYNKLRNFLNLNLGKTQIFDIYQQITKLENDIRELLEVDTVPLLFEPKKWKPFILPDGSPCEIPEKLDITQENDDLIIRDDQGNMTARMPKGGYYFDTISTPLFNINEPLHLDKHSEIIETFDLPFFADESLDAIENRAKHLFENTELALVANLQLHLLAAGQSLRGYENFMMDLITNKKLVHALLERLTDAYISRCEQYLKVIGKYIQVVLVNDDMGTQVGPMMSLDCYREMLFPYQKRLFQFIKSKTEAFLLLHSCGSVYRFIPYLIEAGVDALNPVQVSAADMDTKILKQEFGRDITFWGGGCDTQQILNKGTAADIENEVKKRTNDLAPGGGFVFTQVHNIQGDVPPENIMAMVNAFKKYRDYIS